MAKDPKLQRLPQWLRRGPSRAQCSLFNMVFYHYGLLPLHFDEITPHTGNAMIFFPCQKPKPLDVCPLTPYEVRRGVNKTLADLVAWSLHCSGQGIYPSRGFYGECFDKGSFRSSRCGQPIAQGYRSRVPKTLCVYHAITKVCSVHFF